MQLADLVMRARPRAVCIPSSGVSAPQWSRVHMPMPMPGKDNQLPHHSARQARPTAMRRRSVFDARAVRAFVLRP